MSEHKHISYARIGFLGNPSDLMEHSSVISFTIDNFSATVTLKPSEKLVIQPNPKHDLMEFTSSDNLVHRVDYEGFYGGARLLLSICRSFIRHCKFEKITLEDKNFTLSYETNIPRQCGLGGSSAITSAALKCLIEYYNVNLDYITRQTLIWEAENELGIVAGSQDAGVQDLGGLIFMDSYKKDDYYGIEIDTLPPNLHLIYANSHVDSDMVLDDYHENWAEGFKHQDRLRLDDEGIKRTDAQLVEIANLAKEGFTVLTQYDGVAKVERLKELVNKNFELRRKIYGDKYVRETQMIEFARGLGAAAKFTGSGLGVLVLGPEEPSKLELLQKECEKAGYLIVKVKAVNPHGYDSIY